LAAIEARSRSNCPRSSPLAGGREANTLDDHTAQRKSQYFGTLQKNELWLDSRQQVGPPYDASHDLFDFILAPAADPERKLGAFGDQIFVAIRHDQIDLQARVLIEKGGEKRRDPPRAIGRPMSGRATCR
jgi:hypothetical protein